MPLYSKLRIIYINIKFTINLHLILIFYNSLYSKLLLVLYSSSIYNRLRIYILIIKINLDSYIFKINNNNFKLNDI